VRSGRWRRPPRPGASDAHPTQTLRVPSLRQVVYTPSVQADFLQQMMAYVGFEARHAEALVGMLPRVRHGFPAIVDRFYDAVLATPEALAVFVQGPAQIERQKAQLSAWLESVFSGTYDGAYLQRRARIGRTHVRIKLDQRYAIGGMNIVRSGLHMATQASQLEHDAIDKIVDLELAIMVQTYAEDSHARLRDQERLATLGQLAGFIGHELRNPLAVMETSLHLLRKRLPADDAALARHANRLGEQLRTCGEIITSLVELARDRPLERSVVELEPLVREAVRAVTLSAGASLTLRLEPMPPALLDPKALRQLLVNLLGNASEAVVLVDTRKLELAASRERDVLLIVVEDSGPGIAPDLRLFEPLATTRQKGLGLGLALCRRIAEKHGGDIRLASGALGGARFEVRLPHCFGEVP
jgi:two-component system sensor histidine kinase HydH